MNNRSKNKIQIVIKDDICSITLDDGKYIIKALPPKESKYKMHIEYYLMFDKYSDAKIYNNQPDTEWDDYLLDVGEFKVFLQHWNDYDNIWTISYNNE